MATDALRRAPCLPLSRTPSIRLGPIASLAIHIMQCSPNVSVFFVRCSHRPCGAEMSTELAPSEHGLLLNPLDQSDAVRSASNPLPDVLTFDHALSSADVQTVLPT